MESLPPHIGDNKQESITMGETLSPHIGDDTQESITMVATLPYTGDKPKETDHKAF
jgi:hypothetical protein